MRIIDSQDRPKRRPPTSRRRSRGSRRFTSGFSALESRQLPSVAVPVADPTAEVAVAPALVVGPVQSPVPPSSTTSTTTAADDDSTGGSTQASLAGLLGPGGDWPGGPPVGPAIPEGMRPGWATPVPTNRPPGAMPGGWAGGRVSMSQANAVIAGASTSEFAFADEQTGRISVVVGGQPRFSYLIDPGQATVKLADLNRDGLPDLIVADCADDSVLVFLGQSGGNFGTGPNALRQFAVGDQPAGITVGNVDGDPGSPPDLIVANKGSDDVTILLGQGQGSSWTMTAAASAPQLPAGSAPVKTLLADVDRDGNPDLFVLNSGSDDVYFYRGEGGGAFNFDAPTILPVGHAPEDMFVGRFDHRPGLDLVTVNSGSNDLTFISSIGSLQPTTMTYSSGGTQPDAAIAIDPMQDGFLDLVVANGGDGRLALLQPASVGLQLAGVISRADVPSPTDIVPGMSSDGTIDFYAATAGLDAAAILHFDLGPASTYLAVPLESAGTINIGDDELVARLLPFGESALDIIAVLWSGSDEPEAHATTSNTAYYANGVGQADEESSQPGPAATASGDPEPAPLAMEPDDPTSWARFVLGVEEALRGPLGAVDPVGESDASEARGDDRDPSGRPAFARQAGDLDARAVDDALNSIWSEGSSRASAAPDWSGGTGPVTPEPGSAGDLPAGLETRGEDARSEAIPVVSSTLLAARLILKASPPRPPSFRRGVARPATIGPVGGKPAGV